MKLHWIFNRFMGPEDAGASGGGAAGDRGDEWTPTPEDGDTPPAGVQDDDDDGKGKPADKKPAAAKPADGMRREEDDDAPTDQDDPAPADDKGKGKGKDSRIPLDRHEAILQRERQAREAAERELAQLRQGQQLAKSNEDLTKAEDQIVDMEAKYMAALEKGEVKEAQRLMTEIRRAERAVSEQRAQFAAQAAEARAYERVRYDTTVERLEAAYPQINPDHEDFDKDLTAEVVEMRDAYVASGKYNRADALQKAVKNLLGTSSRKQESAVDTSVRPDKEDVAAEVRAQRKKEAVARALETKDKQPPSTKGIGADHDKAGGKLQARDVVKFSQDEFSKLSEADLAALRGDDA